MFGVPLIGPARVFCDNQGVVKNTSIPESVLSKKHNAVNYHAVREAAAARILIVGKEDGTTNLADLFTKSLTADKRKALLSSIYSIFRRHKGNMHPTLNTELGKLKGVIWVSRGLRHWTLLQSVSKYQYSKPSGFAVRRR
jgi:hypothetical protein